MAADTNRDLRNSIYKKVTDLLSSPPASAGFTSAFTVYNETKLREAQAGTLTVVRPCCFVVDRSLRPVETALPLVVIETIISTSLFEIGNINGVSFETTLHCFGRQRNEASLLADFFRKNFRPLTIYDYSNPNSLTTRETAVIDPKIEITMGFAGENFRNQGAFDHWFMTTIRGTCKDS